MKNAIVLCSGGIDSVTTAHYIKKRLNYQNLILLFFNYNQRTINNEKKASKKCARDLKAEFIEISLPYLSKISKSLINKKGRVKKLTKKDLKNTIKESKKYYVPCRNTVFLIYALALAESIFIEKRRIYDIFVGFKCEGKESYPDTTKEFVEQINKLSNISCSKKFRIISPLINKDKEDIIKLGNRLGINFKDTYSCYIGAKKTNKHCGYCLSCKLRQAGFYWAGLKDPTEYKEKSDFIN